jgi:hypothetical protein
VRLRYTGCNTDRFAHTNFDISGTGRGPGVACGDVRAPPSRLAGPGLRPARSPTGFVAQRRELWCTSSEMPGQRSLRSSARRGARTLGLLSALAFTTGVSAPEGAIVTRDPQARNIACDGRFTFARLSYTTGPGDYYYFGMPA